MYNLLSFLNIYRLFQKKSILYKIIIFIFILFPSVKYIKTHKYNLKIDYNYLNITEKFDFINVTKIKNKIKIAVYSYTLKNGGRARITSLLLNYLSKINIFEIFLFTVKMKQNNEYFIPKNIKRVITKTNLIKYIKSYKIDILIYQLDYINEINYLNNMKNIKVIFYIHSSSFYWIYANYSFFKELYNSYLKSRYLVSLVPIENYYLFKKWGIKSIFMYNYMTYNYNSIITSKLSSKTILMLGRANDLKKRFNIGILSMEYIIQETPNCELKIISNLTGIYNLIDLINNLHLKKTIHFTGYSSIPEIYFKNASLNFFPSIGESFGLVLSETKMYGIPNILLGLDYVAISNGGTVIIYDDKPESLAKNAIRILNNMTYKFILGRDAKKSMKRFNNEILLTKWIKLIISVYMGEKSYEEFRQKDLDMKEEIKLKILYNQINLLNMRKYFSKILAVKDFENFKLINNFY